MASFYFKGLFSRGAFGNQEDTKNGGRGFVALINPDSYWVTFSVKNFRAMGGQRSETAVA
jgi:hypothetical protein